MNKLIIQMVFLAICSFATSLSAQNSSGQGQANSTGVTEPGEDTVNLARGLHTLSIHVRDTITHDSIYRFLKEILGIPVYYTPVSYGVRRYVGLYAGNLVLEPCGPYPDISYAAKDFRAIFYGMNFHAALPAATCAGILEERNIACDIHQGFIYIWDSILSRGDLFVALYEVTDPERRALLRDQLSQVAGNGAGIEYIREIRAGYAGDSSLLAWQNMLRPKIIDGSGVCHLNDSLMIRFIADPLNRVTGITFKVRSLEQTKRYFNDRDLAARVDENQLLVDPEKAFGLQLRFME